MQNQLAKLKPVRPFKMSPHQSSKNDDFLNWFQKSWKSRSIELGCGAGWHSLEYAKNHPDHCLLAIERTQNKFSSFQQRLKNHNLSNLMGVREDALDFLPQNLRKGWVDQYFILYPNPYPKEKQANKRWHRSPFFEFLVDSLKPGGLIHFATNESWYFDECLSYGTQLWHLNLVENQRVTHGQSSPRTHFEKKYLQSGQTCYRFCFQKPESI